MTDTTSEAHMTLVVMEKTLIENIKQYLDFAMRKYGEHKKKGAVIILCDHGKLKSPYYSLAETVIEQARGRGKIKEMLEDYDPSKQAVIVSVVNYINNEGLEGNELRSYKIGV